MESYSDENLLTLIAHEDRLALEELYYRYATQVFSLARYILKDSAQAEEVAQDVFLSVWQKAPTFRSSRGSPKGWLMSIAHHRSIDHIRKGKRARASMERVAKEAEQLLAHPTFETEETAQRNMDREEILQALQNIPEAQRTPILMSYFQGYSQSEIAELLDQPLGTIKTRMRLGMQKLRAQFTAATE